MYVQVHKMFPRYKKSAHPRPSVIPLSSCANRKDLSTFLLYVYVHYNMYNSIIFRCCACITSTLLIHLYTYVFKIRFFLTQQHIKSTALLTLLRNYLETEKYRPEWRKTSLRFERRSGLGSGSYRQECHDRHYG